MGAYLRVSAFFVNQKTFKQKNVVSNSVSDFSSEIEIPLRLISRTHSSEKCLSYKKFKNSKNSGSFYLI